MSEHFTVAELSFSQTATRRGIDNTVPSALMANVVRLCNVLEQVRALVGAPINVSSGYRCAALNMAIGGAKNSAHTLALAADITTPALSPKALALLIQQSTIQYDQLILEGTWVHLGLADGVMRRESLTATFNNGKATYSKGLN